MQNTLIQKAAEYISTTIGSKVEIESIEYKMPASIILNGVYVEDQHKDTLAYIGEAIAGVRVLPLLTGHVNIYEMKVDSTIFHLKADSTGKTNLQFIIDAFDTGANNSANTSISLKAPDIVIKNSRFIFDNIDQERIPGLSFDPNHIDVRDLNLEATLYTASADSAKASIDHLSLKEHCGISINDLNAVYTYGKTGMQLENFSLKMATSTVKIPLASITYKSVNDLTNLQDLLNNASITVDLEQATLCGSDFACFTPVLGNLSSNLDIQTGLSYKKDVLGLDKFILNYGTATNIDMDARVEGIIEAFSTPDTILADKLYCSIVAGDISTATSDIESTVAALTGNSNIWPEDLNKITSFQFKGKLDGTVQNAKYIGSLTTNAGVINSDAIFGFNLKDKRASVDGNIGLDNFDLSKLLPDSAKIGKLSFSMNAVAEYGFNDNNISATAKGLISAFEYSGYTYKDITLDGAYNSDLAFADVTFHDANGNGDVDLHATFDNRSTVKEATLDLLIQEVKPSNLGFKTPYPLLSLSTKVDAAMHFTSIDDITGGIDINSVKIENGDLIYTSGDINIDMMNDGSAQHFIVNTPLITGSIDGKYTLSTMFNNIANVFAKELNNIKPMQSIGKMNSSNNFTFNFNINPLDNITELFDIKQSIADTTRITGSFNDYTGVLEANIETNNITLGAPTIDSVTVNINNLNNGVNVDIAGIYKTPIDTTHLGLKTNLKNNLANLSYNFWNTIESDFSGEIKLSAEFFKPKFSDASIEVLGTLHDSKVTLSDSAWNLQEGTVFYDEHKLIVKDFGFEGGNSYLRIDGGADKDKQGGIIKVDMKQVDLSYISNVFYMPDIKLLGIATGKVVVANALNKAPVLDADVDVKGFGLNGYAIADAKGTAKFNHTNKRIELFAEVLNEKRDTSYLHGYVAPVENEMLLDIDINDLHLKFIEPYVKVFANEFDGIANGKLYVGGPLDKVNIWGDAYVHDATIGISFLNSTFHLSDSIHIKKDRFIFNNVKISDDYGHLGSVNGLVVHKDFQNFKYNIDLDINNTKILNTTANESPDFYGTIFASGKAVINGDDNQVNIAVTAKPEAGSYFAVPLDNYRTVSDNNFIKFINKDTIKARLENRGKHRFKITAPTTQVNVDIAVEATPDLEARIIMDSHSGDVIRGRGNGNIKVTVDQNANVKLYGKYALTEGAYNFSMQGAIRKQFDVGENSSITFDGDPMDGVMDIQAMYQTTASLTDLLEESMLMDINNTNVKVNCIANITGKLLEPKISFDLKLPNSDDEVERRVKATVNTEDMMMQQMVFLLMFGKFYNSQLATNAASSTSSYASSFATSTISSQLNYWMSQINNNVNMGINYNDSQKDATNNYSVAVNFTTNLFNNRLVVYSNLGYQRQNGQENFIGDVDVEYKLTKSGRFRLKAYNKTNDILYSSALYTQGVGIMYKETFDTWANLGKTYRELTRKKTEEEKAAIAEQKARDKAERAKRKAAKKALREDRKRRHKEYVAQQKALKAAKKEKK